MTRARSVLLILFLLAGSLSPPPAGAQGVEAARSPPRNVQAFSLEQNYPDPVNPETWIPFSLDAPLFESRDEVAVTMRIYNILNQVIAIPEAVEHPAGRGIRINNLGYAEPGRKFAYWDGRDQAGRQVPSGVYYIQLMVDLSDVPDTRKLVVLNNPRRRRILPW